MLYASFQRWLNAVPLHDPIERRLAPLIQVTLIALALAAVMSVSVGLVSVGSAALSLQALTPSALFVVAMLLALVILRSGRFKTALWVITGATLVAQIRNTFAADFQTGGAILVAYVIPIALAGLLINRRAMFLVLIVSAVVVQMAASRNLPEPTANATTVFFLLIYGLFSFLLALFSRAFRTELAASIARSEELARLSERLKVTLTSIGDAVITTDSAGRVLLMNRVAEQLTGWSQADAAGKPLREIFHIINEETRQLVENPADEVLRARAVVGLANHTILIARDGREIPIDDSGAPIRDSADNIVGVVLVFRDITERRVTEQENKRLFEAERDARADAERTAQQLSRLQEVAAALSGALTYQQVTEVVLERGLTMLGTLTGSVALVTEDGRDLRILRGKGYSPDLIEKLQQFPLAEAFPLSDAVRTNQPVWIESLDDYSQKYPHMTSTIQPQTQTQALACVPLRVHDRVIGGIGVSFLQPRRFADDDRTFLLALADQCAQALERARLYEAEAEARRNAERASHQVTRVLESITDAYYGLNRDWEFTYVNQEAGRVLGKSSESLVGRNIWDEFSPADHTELYAAYHRAVAEGETVSIEYYYEALETWFDVRAYPSKNGLFVYFRDITDRKRTEDILRRSEQVAWQQVAEIEAIYNTAPVGLGVLDTNLRFQRINKRLAEMNGFAPQEHIGRSISDLLPGVATKVEAHMRQIIETGEPVLNLELSGETAAQPGVRRYWIENWQPIKDQDGKVVCINVVTEDVTERKQIEAAEHKQRILAESLRDITIAISSTLELNEVLDRILENVRRVVPHDASLILLVEEGVASVQRTRGFEVYPAIRQAVETLDMEVEKTPALQEMVETRRPLIIADINEYHGWVRAPDIDGQRLCSFAGTPIFLHGELIGFLDLFSTSRGFFSESHAERLHLLAETIAIAIQNAQLYRQVQEVAAYEERQRLARDLHDAVSQTLFSATTIAESLPRLWQGSPEKTMGRIEQVVMLNRAAMAEMRTLLLELRPEAIINTRLDRLLNQLVEVVQGRKRMEAELAIEGSDDLLPPGVHLAMYRIAQESLNNILKHSQATHFTVQLRRRPDQVSLCIRDNGRGFNLGEVPAGIGLESMRERAAGIGASLNLSSTPGQGTEVMVIWQGEPSVQLSAGE